MAKKPCAICGAEYNEGHLLFADQGQICVGCEAELEEAKEVHSGVYSAMAAGPLMAFTATMFMFGTCIPGFGQVVIAGTPFVAVLAIIAGLRAIRHGYLADPANGYSSMEIGLLYASGIFSIAWSIPLSMMACGQLLMFVYAMGMQA